MLTSRRRFAAVLVFVLFISATAEASRSALPLLNEPCADITDTFAWVSNGTHDKLYLIMNVNPMHEPGSGNQGLRACDGYRYEFHIGKGTSLRDEAVYRVEFKTVLAPEAAPLAGDSLGGGNEVLWQLTGATEQMTVTRVLAPGAATPTVIGANLNVLPNNIGPQTDRLVYGLGAFSGYQSGDRSSRENGLYDQTFIDSYIATLTGGGRVIAGEFDDPSPLDEKGIADIFNFGGGDVGGIPGARTTPIEDVHSGFNVFSIALEIPTAEIFPAGIPHNGERQDVATDSLMRIWSSVSRQAIQTVDPTNLITGLRGSGNFTQVGRNGLPLVTTLIIGTQRQSLYVHSDPLKDITRFGADVLFPVLVRDVDALGLYQALGVPSSAVTTLKGPRLDIINAINLGRPIPVADGSTGDVITLDASIDSQFPNGRRLGGGTLANRHQVNVNSVLISLLLAGDPGAALAKGVEINDKDFLIRFPFLAPANQGLLQGHGGINTPTQPTIPNPNVP
jgi:hypothetical protein